MEWSYDAEGREKDASDYVTRETLSNEAKTDLLISEAVALYTALMTMTLPGMPAVTGAVEARFQAVTFMQELTPADLATEVTLKAWPINRGKTLRLTK